MSRLTIIIAILTGLTIVGTADQSFGERRGYQPYRPSRPIFSPWFGLYERNAGPLPNYFYFVRPRQELQRDLEEQGRINQRQRRLNTQQDERVNKLQGEVTHLERVTSARPTGHNSGYLNYRTRFMNSRVYFAPHGSNRGR